MHNTNVISITSTAAIKSLMNKVIVALILCLALFGLANSRMESGLCPCPKILNPVCGTDSKTYTNPCELNCAVKAGRADLKIAKEGPCD